MPNGPPSREEYNALVHRIDLIDERGTSAAGGVRQRLDIVEEGLKELRGQLAEEKRRRSDTRKWLIGIALSVAGLALGVTSFVAVYIFHLT